MGARQRARSRPRGVLGDSLRPPPAAAPRTQARRSAQRVEVFDEVLRKSRRLEPVSIGSVIASAPASVLNCLEMADH